MRRKVIQLETLGTVPYDIPDRHRNCPNVVELSNRVYDSPMALSDLNILPPQHMLRRFRPICYR
jgi:hypothetical protein